MLYDQFRAMNTEIVLAADGEAEQVQAGFEAARRFITRSEARFSRFLEDSELSQLNRSAGCPFAASADLFEVVQTAFAYVDATEGLFNPAILGALRQAGYDRSLDEIRAAGTAPHQDVVQGASLDTRAVRLEPAGRKIWLPAGMGLDLGGIAKGWIAEQAAAILADYASAGAVSAGGDLCLYGIPPGESAWEVALEDPRDPEESLGALRVGSGALATSSITKRRWRQGERIQHHLIDPRTAQPAETPWLSVTAFAPQATQAEVWAKTLLIAGPLEATRLQRRCPDVAFIAVDQDGHLWGSARAQEVFNVGVQFTAAA